MTDTRLVYERVDRHVAVLRLNRPDRLNAVDRATLTRLHELLGTFASDADLRAVVLTGTGRAFSAGADLKEMEENPQLGPTIADAHRMLHQFQDVTRRMVALPAVIITAVNGIAVGVGAELALASDIRIGTERSELMLSEVRRGLFETNGVMHYLPRVVGHGRAAQWLLTGERVPARELIAAGFLTEMVASDQLMPRALELAATIAGNAPVSVRLLKRLLHRTWDVDLETMLQYEVDGMLACMASDDMKEGLRAFAEKRAPRWAGH